MQQPCRKLLLITGIAFVVSATVPVVAQNPPARTYQPGYWQPIARVNPNLPVTVTLVNKTKLPLKYSLLDEKTEQDLAIGTSKQLSNVSLPANIAIYDPSPQTDPRENSGLNYETLVTKNAITVNILPVETEGFQVININKAGGIYRY